eukprot:Gb_08656 [translate_table: standard]
MQVVREHDAYGRDVELFRRHFYEEGKEKPTTKGTKGSELVEDLVIQEGDYKLVKTRFSAFFATNLHYLLQRAGILSVVVVDSSPTWRSGVLLGQKCPGHRIDGIGTSPSPGSMTWSLSNISCG